MKYANEMRNINIPSKRLVASYVFDWVVIMYVFPTYTPLAAC